MSGRAENEGFRMLEEFVCQAIPGPGIPQAESRHGGENEGVRIVEEFVVDMSCGASQGDKSSKIKSEPERPSAQGAIKTPSASVPIMVASLGAAAGAGVGYLLAGPVGVAVGGALVGAASAFCVGLLGRKHRVGKT
jgi:hypothetical protein